MAKAKTKAPTIVVRIERNVSRPGVHAKTKMSKNKNSKNYVKPYRGQGR